MNEGKIVSIANGMTHLIEEANPAPRARKPLDDGTCIKMRCILEATDYYAPVGGCGILEEPPYCPFYMPVGYSACLDPANGKVISITKHIDKRFFQTGISTEIVKQPAWWGRREEGVI